MKTGFIGLAALFAVGTAGQALAAAAALTDRFVNIYIAPEPSRAEVVAPFDVAPEALVISASEGDVTCSAITAITAAGGSYMLFEGNIAEGDETRVTVPAEARDLARIGIECHTDDPLRAKLDIAAETA